MQTAISKTKIERERRNTWMEKIELSYANNQALLNNFHPKIYCDSKFEKIHTIEKKKIKIEEKIC